MKKKILYISILWLCAAACSKVDSPLARQPLSIRVSSGAQAITTEDLIWDINLYITDTDGDMVEYSYIPLEGQSGKTLNFNLMKQQPYSIYVMANAGYRIGPMSRDELLEYRYSLRYPDSFDHGMPMSGVVEDFVLDEDSARVDIPLERLLAKIKVKMDCSELDDGVKMNIFSTRIGNCPRRVRPFGESSVRDEDDLFSTGYTCTFSGGDFTMYCLENCQSNPPKLCTFVQIDIDYLSPTMESPPGRGLIYRFYLRENDDFCVRRGSLYNITVTPTGDGTLTDDSWRIDSSSLRERQVLITQ